MFYQKMIKAILDDMGENTDPRHVEALMRCKHEVLDALSPAAFTKAAKASVREAKEYGEEMCERFAKMYWL